MIWSVPERASLPRKEPENKAATVEPLLKDTPEMRIPLYTGHLPGPQGVHNRGVPLYSNGIKVELHVVSPPGLSSTNTKKVLSSLSLVYFFYTRWV